MNKENLIKSLESIGADITKMIDAGISVSEAIGILNLMESRITSFSLELINVNQEDQLTRIADALESISTSLSDIAETLESIDQNLDSCISRSGSNSFLCVTGNISTY